MQKPLLFIFGVTALFLVGLVCLDLLVGESAIREWTWILYLVGAVLLFLIYRGRSQGGTGSREAPRETAQEMDDSEKRLPTEPEIEAVRKRVRDRKHSGSSDPDRS